MNKSPVQQRLSSGGGSRGPALQRSASAESSNTATSVASVGQASTVSSTGTGGGASGGSAGDKTSNSLSSEFMRSADNSQTSDSTMVSIPMGDLRRMMEEVIERKVGRGMMMKGGEDERTYSFDEDDEDGYRMAHKNLSNSSVSSGDDNSEPLARILSSDGMTPGPSSPKSQSRLQTRTSDSAGSGGDSLGLEHAFDCDPRAWIFAAGRLEKKRDGFVKGGWSKRFFVLSCHTLYYYLMPKSRTNKGENTSLLGDERGQIKISNIHTIQVLESDEGCVIKLGCGDIKKRGITQSSNTNIDLRASTAELGRKWADILRKVRDGYMQNKNSVRPGMGTMLDGYIPQTTYDSFVSTGVLSLEQQEALEAAERSRRMLEIEVIPFVARAAGAGLRVDGSRANHIEAYFAFAGLVCVNSFCYLGPALNEIPMWLLVNLGFLSFVVYYEKLAKEHDQQLFRFTRNAKAVQSNFDKLTFMIRRAAGLEDEDQNNMPVSPRSQPPFSPSKPGLESNEPFVFPSTDALPSPGKEDSSQVKTAEDVPQASSTSKPLGGKTMPYAPPGEESIDCSWSGCEANTFRVRQVGYKQSKEKAPSIDSLYEAVGMDLLKADNKIEGVHTLLQIPPPRPEDDLELIKKSGLPRIFMVNIQTPLKTPSPWGSNDPGASVVLYFSIKPETAKAAAEDSDRPEIKLLKKFVKTHHQDDSVRRKFKGIGIAANFDDLGLPKQTKGLNGKPVILFKTAFIQMAPETMEINVRVHSFGLMAKAMLANFMSAAPNIKIKAAFLLEGEDDSELPEVVIGCASIFNLQFDKAKRLHDLLMGHT